MILRNTTDSEVTYYPGDTVATLDPMCFEDSKDKAGHKYLYLGIDGQLHPKILSTNPNQMGSYDCAQQLLPLSKHPVAIKKLTMDKKDIVTESIEPLSIEEILEYAKREGHIPVRKIDKVRDLEDRMEDKVTLPTGEEYSYKDVKVNPNLTEVEKQAIWTFLEKHKDFFAPIKQSYPNKKLGGFATQYIKLKAGIQPFKSRAYPLTERKRKMMKDILDSQLSKGMIRPSQSQFTSPAFLVPKPGGKARLVVDYRVLNSSIEKSSWLIPRMNEILDKLAGSTYLSSLDLVDGFHQCPLHKDSRQYTAFITAAGCYEYTTSPMGLATSPNHYQFVMETVLSGKAGQVERHRRQEEAGQPPTTSESDDTENLIGQISYLYIDDILIVNKGDIHDHLSNVEKVINRLSKFGLKAKATKAVIAMTELKFLGFMVGRQGKWPDPNKTRAIDEVPIPKGSKSKSQLHAFLGLAGFYRSHIKNFAKITACLYDLLKKRGRKIDRYWQQCHTDAFLELKEAFKKAPILVHPDFDKPFFIKTDCSKTHAGAILGQMVDGTERVIEYASTKLTPAQRKWHMTHLEGYAVVWALEKWKRFIEGREDTKVIVDHKSLLYLKHNKFADASGKIARWMVFLDTFNIHLQHRHGDEHADCDALTRMYEGDPDITWEPADPTADWIFDVLQDYIPEGRNIQQVDFGGPMGSTEFKKQRNAMTIDESQILHFPRAKSEIVVAVPPSSRSIIAPLFANLRDSGATWAVWCPLKVLQASYFTEPDVQLIVIQGSLGYGSTRRGTPERGAWITHGLGLKNNIFLRSKTNKKGTTFEKVKSKYAALKKVCSVKADWKIWKEENDNLKHFRPIPEFKDVEQFQAFQDQINNELDFEKTTDQLIHDQKSRVRHINSYSSSWGKLDRLMLKRYSAKSDRGWEKDRHKQKDFRKHFPNSIREYVQHASKYTEHQPFKIPVRPVTTEHKDDGNDEDDDAPKRFKPSDLVTAKVKERLEHVQ